jgi:hypothetical protein
MRLAENVASIPLTVRPNRKLATFYRHCSMFFLKSAFQLATQRPGFADTHVKDRLQGIKHSQLTIP